MKISIAVPTRERAEYLRYALETCVHVDGDIEIVVSDNVSTDNTRDVCDSFKDGRIKYVRTEARVSMRLNFENALNNCTGEYIIFMGDDDGILPKQFPILRQILNNRRPEALGWASRYYLWPDLKQKYSVGGRIRLKSKQTFGGVDDIRASSVRDRLYAAKIESTERLPMIYHGAVSRKFIDTLKGRSGDLFMGSSPDVYFNMAAASMVESFSWIEHPFSIQAISPKSTGYSGRFEASPNTTTAPVNIFREEAATDPLIEEIRDVWPYPAYALSMLECANLYVNDGKLPLDRQAWRNAVEASLSSLSVEKRQRTIAGMQAWCQSKGLDPNFNVDLTHEPAAKGNMQKFRLPSYLLPGKILLDATRFGSGNILETAHLIDYVLGSDSAWLDGHGRSAAWLGALARAFGLLMGGRVPS